MPVAAQLKWQPFAIGEKKRHAARLFQPLHHILEVFDWSRIMTKVVSSQV
jgi:hypothetical protein